jgi:hypothetical protein
MTVSPDCVCAEEDACCDGCRPKEDGSACTTGNPCAPAGTCQGGLCEGIALPDGSPCDDANLCTENDGCLSGACTGDEVICQALDQCHQAGQCQPDTGLCTDPIQEDGTPCDDINPCTLTDSCQAGACVGADPLTCTPLDQCHLAGVCEPSTGQCTNPAKPDGTACDDSDACTRADTCQAGGCAGADPVVCEPLDACHLAGACDPLTGICSDPLAPDGTACDDQDACTLTDSCLAGACQGADPVQCTALDVCHLAGTCDPATGTCSNPNAPNDTACDDFNACTRSDSCQSGACTGADPVVCQASDSCHMSGSCDPQTGECSNPVKDDGDPCDDGDLCTLHDSCQAGSCVGLDPAECDDGDSCTESSCDPQRGCIHSPIQGCKQQKSGCGCGLAGRHDGFAIFALLAGLAFLAFRRRERT